MNLSELDVAVNATITAIEACEKYDHLSGREIGRTISMLCGYYAKDLTKERVLENGKYLRDQIQRQQTRDRILASLTEEERKCFE